MLRTRLIVPLALVASVAAAVPAGAVEWQPEAALPTCSADLATKFTEYHETRYVTGTATVKGAVDVRLTCGLVRWGATVATVSESAPGPVAVVAGSRTIMGALHEVCAVVEAWYPDGRYAVVSDNCP